MRQPAPLVIGRRYRLEHQLGAGGMGTVYYASDRLSGHAVALKRVLSNSHDDLTNSDEGGVDLRITLAQEFRLLASLRHPHVIGVQDYGFDDAHLPYYTMELLESAQSFTEAGEDVSLDVRVNLLVQLLRAMAYISRRGIIHRDLKPSNVLVTNGHVKVLDFGLSVVSSQAQQEGTTTVGTLAYMAPEVLLGAPATHQSDLYAVGVMAYELFTGRHPYLSGEVTSLVRAVLYNEPDFSLAGLPAALELLLHRLLAKEPEDRFEDASTVLNVLHDSLEHPILLETVDTRESFLQAARLVGRDAELEQLTQALEAAKQGVGSAWLIGGESGVGKSRLLDEIATLGMVQGALVVRGQVVEQGAVPFQVWRPLVRWLALLGVADEVEAQLLQSVVPDLAALLERPLPKQGALNKKTHAKLYRLVEDLLRRVAQPMVIIMEDLQWMGNESLELLRHLAQATASLPLLVVGSYRDDERPELPDELPAAHVLRLNRLAPDQIAELSEAMLGAGGRAPHILSLLNRETEGNVYFLIEVVRALAEEAGQLDRVSFMTLPEQVFAGGMQRIIERRLNTVAPEHRELVQLAAIYGRDLDLAVLRAAAPALNLDDWLTDCANAAVLETLDGQWRFTHDKLREGAIRNLSPDALSARHTAVARAIEQAHPDDPQQCAALAYHWGAAGDAERESAYTLLAVDVAQQGGAFEEALRMLERTLVLAREARPPSEARAREAVVRVRTAEAYAGLGRYDDAVIAYEVALALRSELHDRKGMADVYIGLGDVVYAEERFEEAGGYYQQGHDLYEAVGDVAGVVRALNSLGNVAYDLDDYDRANALYQKSLALSREMGNQWGMAGSFGGGDSSSTHDSHFG